MGARRNLTVYDAGHVALAELLRAARATLDRRIGRAPELRCEVTAPQAQRAAGNPRASLVAKRSHAAAMCSAYVVAEPMAWRSIVDGW